MGCERRAWCGVQGECSAGIGCWRAFWPVLVAGFLACPRVLDGRGGLGVFGLSLSSPPERRAFWPVLVAGFLACPRVLACSGAGRPGRSRSFRPVLVFPRVVGWKRAVADSSACPCLWMVGGLSLSLDGRYPSGYECRCCRRPLHRKRPRWRCAVRTLSRRKTARLGHCRQAQGSKPTWRTPRLRSCGWFRWPGLASHVAWAAPIVFFTRRYGSLGRTRQIGFG
jgi:hypothetical protein